MDVGPFLQALRWQQSPSRCRQPQRTSVPGPPGVLTSNVSGRTVTLGWTTPATGGTPAGCVLEAGAQPGRAVIVTIPVAGLQLCGGGSAGPVLCAQ